MGILCCQQAHCPTMASDGAWLHALTVSCLLVLSLGQSKLYVGDGALRLGGEKVYLSGVNQAWVNYACDFGQGHYNKTRPQLMKTLDSIYDNGGNSLRMWLHIDGSSTPNFNSSGFVTGLDRYLIHDLTDFLNEAGKRNILITLVLWNCAVKPGHRLGGLLYDDSKLQSYIDNGLRPLVKALRNNSALGMWEIVNEPEGCVDVDHASSETCYDTTSLNFLDFADWTHAHVPLQRLLVFIGRQVTAIHEEDNEALVTVGSWTYKSVTNQFARRNFYSDHCLQLASGQNNSGLDLYQIHTYSTLGIYWPTDPFKVSATKYALDKPVIIGEFSQKKGAGLSAAQQFSWGYHHGYSGTWGWSVRGGDPAADNLHVLETGMRELRGQNNQSAGGIVNFVIPSQQSDSWHMYPIRFFMFLYSFFMN
ncbi:mannan endo-1,4-beta-mannosidase-like [Haliotis rufescens]|uniref:mannan endo-1,4-beta-mannosidase-like n=1 Tax=Haliotis rufescens TaxID=6454 RepID=UPI00201F2092|nr:mannan endo-1,4-beta-mannosidase-like [Haliotis rufescens]